MPLPSRGRLWPARELDRPDPRIPGFDELVLAGRSHPAASHRPSPPRRAVPLLVICLAASFARAPPPCLVCAAGLPCAVSWMCIGCDLVVHGLSFIHPVLSEESNINCMFCRKRLPFWHQVVKLTCCILNSRSYVEAVVEEMLGERGAQSTWL
ncbi:unnamed protein product [Urochloa humidicola]